MLKRDASVCETKANPVKIRGTAFAKISAMLYIPKGKKKYISIDDEGFSPKITSLFHLKQADDD